MGDVPKPPVPDIVIQILGGDWPEGSETAMRELADIWDAAAKNFKDAQTDGTTALKNLLAQIQSDSEAAMEDAVNEILIEQYGLPAQIAASEEAARLCRDYAGDLEITKWAINLAMVEAAASIAFMLLGPGGIAAATVKLAAKRLAMRELIRQAAQRIAFRGASAAGKMVAKSPTARTLAKHIGVEIAEQSVMNTLFEGGAQFIANARSGTGFHADRLGRTALSAGAFGAGSGAVRGRMGSGLRSAVASGAAGAATSSMAMGGGVNTQDMAFSAIESATGGTGVNTNANANSSAQSTSPSSPASGARSPSHDGPAMAPSLDTAPSGPDGPGPLGETVTLDSSTNNDAAAPAPSTTDDSALAAHQGPVAESGDQGPPSGGETVTPGNLDDSSTSLNLPDATTGQTPPATGTSDSGIPAHGDGDAAPTDGAPSNAETANANAQPGTPEPPAHQVSAEPGAVDAPSTDTKGPAHHVAHPGQGSAPSLNDVGNATSVDSGGADVNNSAESPGQAPNADGQSASHNPTGQTPESSVGQAPDSTADQALESAGGQTEAAEAGADANTSVSQQAGGEHSGLQQSSSDGVHGVDTGGTAAAASDGHTGAGHGTAGSTGTVANEGGTATTTGTEGATSASSAHSGSDPAPPAGPPQSPEAIADSQGRLLEGEGTPSSTNAESGADPADVGATPPPTGTEPSSTAPSDAAATGGAPIGVAPIAGAPIGSPAVGAAPTAGTPASTTASTTASGGSTAPSASTNAHTSASSAPASGAKPAASPGASTTHTPHASTHPANAAASTSPAAQSSPATSSNAAAQQSNTPSASATAPAAQPAVAKSATPAAESTVHPRVDGKTAVPTQAVVAASTAAASPSSGTESRSQNRSSDAHSAWDAHADRGSDTSRTPMQTDPMDTANADSRCAQSVLEYLGDKHPHRSFAGLGARDTVPAGELHRATGSRAQTFPVEPVDPFRSTQNAFADIEQKLLAAGHSHSAVISVGKTDAASGPGHALLGENVDGEVMVRDPSTGQYHVWPPQYEENGPVAVSYLDSDGAPVDPVSGDDPSYNEASDTIGEIDGSKKNRPISYTEREIVTDLDSLPQSMVTAHDNLPPGGTTTYYHRTGTMPRTGKVFEEFRAETVFPPGEGVDADHPPLRNGEHVTVTSAWLSEPRSGTEYDPAGPHNTATWTAHGYRTIEARATIRHVYEGIGRAAIDSRTQKALNNPEMTALLANGEKVSGAAFGGTKGRDNAGHIFGHQFFPDMGIPNFFAQSIPFNSPTFSAMENDWKTWVVESDGKARVEVQVRLNHNSESARPTDLRVGFDVRDERDQRIDGMRTRKWKNDASAKYVAAGVKYIRAKLADWFEG